jgi:hypothetical protein
MSKTRQKAGNTRKRRYFAVAGKRTTTNTSKASNPKNHNLHPKNRNWNSNSKTKS